MIPVNQPFLGSPELNNVKECIKSGWISSKGRFISRFEEEFARFCGLKYGITTTSGTTALHLALVALDIGAGDEVIIPDFTMIASAYAVIYTGARPVFVDSEQKTWNMDISQVEGLITRRTKAIMPVHIYGHPVDMDPLRILAHRYGLHIIEDAAESHGAEYKGKRCGSLGDIGAFSFYANKIITTGEGGMIVTDNRKIAQKARRIKDLAHSTQKRFLHTELGYNYRMTNMQAAVGLAQLGRIHESIRKKREIASLYRRNLEQITGIRLPEEEKWAMSVYWMYAFLVEKEFGMGREDLRRELSGEGIETRDFFVPMHKQPVIRKMFPSVKNKKYPVAERISKEGLYLPTGLALRKKDILSVCSALKRIKENIS